ncbi:MAG: flagellar hook-associated protein FlgL [Kineosporiaceae bacterium]
MPVSRITQRSLSDTTLRGLQANITSLQKLQNELSSGHRISRPSDDPSGTGSAMLLSSKKAADVQYLRNIGFANSRLQTTDTTLQALSNQLRSARDLLVQSRNASLNTESMTALAQSVEQIRNEVIDLYNTRYLDRPVFGGTVAGSYAVDPSTGTYLGDDQPVTTRITSESTIRMDVRGTDVGADTVPASLDLLATNITGTGATDADLTALDDALSLVAQALGDIGARETRVSDAESVVTSHKTDLIERISENVDIDLPETIMNLESQKVAYQSALGAAARILQKSLVVFLS